MSQGATCRGGWKGSSSMKHSWVAVCTVRIRTAGSLKILLNLDTDQELFAPEARKVLPCNMSPCGNMVCCGAH